MSEVLDKPAAQDEKEKRAVFLAGDRMHLREQVRQDWVIDAAAGTTIEDVLDPQYLAHLATGIELYSRIEVLIESGEWMLELLVMGVGRNWVKTACCKSTNWSRWPRRWRRRRATRSNTRGRTASTR
jgi:hypothetical protein